MKKEVEQIALLVLDREKIDWDEIAIYFVKKNTISSLHGQFFDDPSPTDCITFPLDPPKKKSSSFCFLGEIFICSAVALDYADLHKTNPEEEQRLYLIHALLHLSGYKDQTPCDKKKMRKKEKIYMKMFSQLMGKKIR